MKAHQKKLRSVAGLSGMVFVLSLFSHYPSPRAQPTDVDWTFTSIDSVYMQNSPTTHTDAQGGVYYSIKGKVGGATKTLRFAFSAYDKPALGTPAIRPESPIYKLVENCYRLATLAMVDRQEGGKMYLTFYGQNVSETSTGAAEIDMRNSSNGPMFYCSLIAPGS